MDKYIISSGLIYNDKNQILLAQHTPEFGEGHYWYIPGGTANKGENAIDALRREIKEETNIDISIIGKLVYVVKHTNYKRAWYSDIYVYKIKDWSGDIKINDPDGDTVKLKWFDAKQAIIAIKKVPFQVMSEPLIYYLEGKKPKKEWSYTEHIDSRIELL
ncbi:NUDIX hydrolase [Patescibacteria group bacterium]|nr:NUDIX hydrolase [Patescibacteria group bacterium]